MGELQIQNNNAVRARPYGGRISILMYWVGNFCLFLELTEPRRVYHGSPPRATKTEALTHPWRGRQVSGVRP